MARLQNARKLSLALAAAAIIRCMGCTSPRKPEVVQGIPLRSGEQAALVREKDDCYVRTIDEHDVGSGGFDLFDRYRQYQLPAGHHTLVVQVVIQGMSLEWRGQKLPLSAELEAGHRYMLRSNRSGLIATFGPVTTGEALPDLIDESTQQSVGKCGPGSG